MKKFLIIFASTLLVMILFTLLIMFTDWVAGKENYKEIFKLSTLFIFIGFSLFSTFLFTFSSYISKRFFYKYKYSERIFLIISMIIFYITIGLVDRFTNIF